MTVIALVAVVGLPRGAHALGELTPAGCVDDNDAASGQGPDACDLSTDALNGATAVAVSPDGKSVYATSDNDQAIVRFDRSATGTLTPAGCVDDNDTGPEVCAQATNSLEAAGSVAVSPDGKSVYVTSPSESALVRFNRSTTGALTPAGCVHDNDFADDFCAKQAQGMALALSVAVSPDGKSVYVASVADDAVVQFDRSETGALTVVGCVDDNDTGADNCARSVNGLGGAADVAVSSDGRSVYVASRDDDALVRFDRSSTGALTPAGCVDDNDTGADVCARSVNGLNRASSLAVSPDGNSVYVGSEFDDAIVRFDRSSTGALTPAGCVDDNDTGADVCARSVNGLDGAFSVAVSPDGKSVYVASQDDDALVRFDRSSTGALTPAGCVDDNDSGDDVCAPPAANGLNAPRSVAVSPDGKSVYLASLLDDAVAHFSRKTT